MLYLLFMNTNEIRIFEDVNSKLDIFNRCLDEVGLYRKYPYLDKLFHQNKKIQIELMRNCTRREVILLNKSFINI